MKKPTKTAKPKTKRLDGPVDPTRPPTKPPTGGGGRSSR